LERVGRRRDGFGREGEEGVGGGESGKEGGELVQEMSGEVGCGS